MPVFLQSGTPGTALWGGALGIVFGGLTLQVIRTRRRLKVNMGDGGSPLLQRNIRGQANFAETVPITLGLMATAEGNNFAPTWAIHLLGATLLGARLMHGYAFSQEMAPSVFRVGGTLGTLATLITLSCCCVYGGISNL